MKKTKTILLFALLLPLTRASEGVRVRGHFYPDKTEHVGLEWNRRGAEHFRFRMFSVFTGALYANEETQGKKLIFTYTRALDRDLLVEQGMRVLQDAHDDETLKFFQEPLEALNKAYADVAFGDSYTITAVPGKGTWLHKNDKKLFFIEDDAFGLWYLSIWLGDAPMSLSFRDALLQVES